MWSLKSVNAKIDKRLQYYLIGCVFGCLLLAFLPKPFKVKRSTTGEKSGLLHGDYHYTHTDGYKRTINIPSPPQRIVSLAPSITEIIYAINASEYLVANTLDCKYPKGARNLPKIGARAKPDIEGILQYKPDLILGDLFSSPAQYKQMADLGLVAIAMKQTHLDVILHDMLIVGKLLGQPNAAMQLVMKIQNQRDLIIERISELKKREPVRVIFLYDLDQLVIARSNLWVKEFVTLCQAIDIADEVLKQASQISLGLMTETNPEVIILALSLEDMALTKKEGNLDKLADHSIWKNSTAVRDHQIITMDKDLLSSSGSRILVAMDAIARAIHPDISLSL